MSELKTACGREVHIKGFHYLDSVTFLDRMGVMIQFGSAERWKRGIVEKGAPFMNKAWGDLKAVFVHDIELKPEDADDIDEPDLPSWVVHVWLHSRQGIADGADGSQLVLAFFMKSTAAPIEDAVRRALSKVDWAATAGDIRYEELYPWFFGIIPEDDEDEGDGEDKAGK